MARHNLLLVDDDAKSLRVMEVSLRNAGHVVTTAGSGAEALAKIESARPALVLSDTNMPGMDGYELCRRVKADERFKEIPFIFLTEQTAIEDKIKGLELGADDYLTKPIYIKEVIARVGIALQKRERVALERKDKRRFFGSLEDMGVVDLLQTIELGRKNGVIHFDRPPQQARLWFVDGQVLDAESGKLHGEDAVYRLLTWEDGTFEIDFRPVEHPRRIHTTTQGLLMEGMRRVDEWGRILEQLPSIHTVYQVDYAELAERLAELPDEVNSLLRLFDGHRTAMQAIDDAPMSDLEALAAISRLYFEGIIYAVSPERPALPEERPRALPPPDAGAHRLEAWLAEVMEGEQPGPRGPEPEARFQAAFHAPPAEPEEEGPGALPSTGLVDELLSSAAALPAMAMLPSQPEGALPADALPSEMRAEEALQGMPSASPEGGRGSAQRNPGSLHPPERPAPAAPVPATLGEVQAALPADVREAGAPAPAFLAELADERAFFQELSEESHDLAGLDEPREEPVARAAYVALALVALILVAGGLFWSLRDTVEPRDPPSGALHESWHAAVLKNRPAPVTVPALDASWSALGATDAGVAAAEAPPPPETPVAPTAEPTGEAPAPPPTEAATADPGPEGRERFRAFLDEGLKLHDKRRYREAADRFEKALALAPGNELGLMAYAQTLLELDRPSDALKTAEKVVRINPRNPRAHLIIGSVKQELGQKEAAVEAYQRYLRLAPEDRYADDVRRVMETIR